MTTEEFQKLLLEKFDNLEESVKNLERSVENLETGQKGLEESVKNLETGQKGLEVSVKSLEIGQNEIKKDIRGIVEQTADLTEFREEVMEKLNTLLEENISIHGILGEHEVSIRTLRRMVI